MGCAIRTISLQEEQFRELLKKYNDGDKTAIDEIVTIFAKHIHKNIEAAKGEFSYDVIEALVRDLVIKDLERDRYTRTIAHYSNNYLSSVKNTIKIWQISNTSSVEDIKDRLIARKLKTITNDQWRYEKSLACIGEEDAKTKVMELIYPITFDNLSNYIKNYDKWETLNEQDIEDAIQTIIINKICKNVQKKNMPEEYYNWIIKVKRSLQHYLDSLEKRNLDSLYTKGGLPKIQSLDDFRESLVSPNDPLQSVIIKEKNEDLTRVLHKLKDRTRYVIEKRYFDNATYQEIANKLQVSIRRVEQIEKEGLEKLKKFISKNKGLKQDLTV